MDIWGLQVQRLSRMVPSSAPSFVKVLDGTEHLNSGHHCIVQHLLQNSDEGISYSYSYFFDFDACKFWQGKTRAKRNTVFTAIAYILLYFPSY